LPWMFTPFARWRVVRRFGISQIIVELVKT
jgi:hypothetical protein